MHNQWERKKEPRLVIIMWNKKKKAKYSHSTHFVTWVLLSDYSKLVTPYIIQSIFCENTNANIYLIVLLFRDYIFSSVGVLRYEASQPIINYERPSLGLNICNDFLKLDIHNKSSKYLAIVHRLWFCL